ncbi:Ig-like domain-containing protein [Blautia sp. MSJ-19]|uniref:Ig-like domain-containing protein n=1 Tax=Blautia sp. MSJ-19 TaxID=2841517 RepID=UPI001C0E93C5|nr:Ig-like domain-containing protein [Blautia sp. MSJ-19]MBU5481722.1 Ig-like domain-containing protein [Blautia sp. MSJ-19]
MADTFKGFITSDGRKLRISHNDLVDLPEKGTEISYNDLKDLPEADATLTKTGAFADAKTVGDKFTKSEERIQELKKAIDDADQTGAEIPDNVVLFEEVEDEENPMDIESFVKEKIKENLTLDADGEYIRLLYGEDELGKVPMGNSGVEVVPCTGVTINESDMNIDISSAKSYKFTATVTPADCTQTLRWISSVPTVATISSTGELTVVGEGATVITARCGNYTDTVNISIVDSNVSVGVDKNGGWFISSGAAQLDSNTMRAHTYYGDTPPAQYYTDTNYDYGVPLKKGVTYVVNLENTVSEAFYGAQIYDASTASRLVDAGWKNAGTKYMYTPEKDDLYLYVNFKYTAGGTTITDNILQQIQAAFSVSTEVS